VMIAAMKAVINVKLIESSWKHEGMISFMIEPEKQLRSVDKKNQQHLGGASGAQLVAPTVIVETGSVAVLFVVPKVTKSAREGLA